MNRKFFFVAIFVIALVVGLTSSISAQNSSCSYPVVEGDTLGALAVRWNTSVAAIQASNDLGNSTNIVAGRTVLTVPGCVEVTPTPEFEVTTELLVDPSVDVAEPLIGTLDNFGGLVDEFGWTQRFSLEGEQIKFDLKTGEIWVSNAKAIHNGSFKSQEGCVVAYAQGPTEIYLTGWDGIWFQLSSESGVTLNQGIAAMRDTLTEAHGCKSDGIEFMNVGRASTTSLTVLGVGGGASDPMSVIRGQTTLALGAGSVYDESFALPGELMIGYSVNGGIDQANGASIPKCSILVYETPTQGGRVRFSAANGIVFEWAPDVVNNDTAVEAVTNLAKSTNECVAWSIYQVGRFGDPVN